MPRVERNGRRKTREQTSKKRVPELGYYFIVTDTKETEKNYINGLRDSIPKELQDKLVIKVKKAPTKDLVDEALELASLNPQYCELWIIFDRDQVKNFDEIIERAKVYNIHVGWTNPCIEEWFYAYFGGMPVYKDSVACCNGFSKKFEQVCNKKYDKADPDIYKILNKHGDEEKAIKTARQKYEEHIHDGKYTPSDMNPCTTVHLLVEEIKTKIKSKDV